MTPDLDDQTSPQRTAAPLRRLLYSPAETQHMLGISHAHMYRLLAQGKLRAVKLGARTGITAESIDALLSKTG